MITIRDISEKCGVSVSTVSKALNGYTDISAETLELIRRTAKEMGYLPNSAARALKTNRSNNIGVLFVDKTMSGLTHEYFSHVLNSLKVEAESLGYDITFISSNIGKLGMSYTEHARYRTCDGVVIASVSFDDPAVIELVRSDIPTVTIDHVFDGRASVVSDNVKGISDLVNYIYSKGHRKIAFIHGEDTSVTRNRIASFYKTCSELGITVPEDYVRSAIYHDPKSSGIATKALLALKDRPTCIMYPDDYSYLGGMTELEKQGLSVPRDISTVGYDGIGLSRMLRPKLTTLHQNTEELGRVAARKLISQIENPKLFIPDRTMVAGELYEGRSVADIN